MVITAKANLDQLRNLKELPRAQGPPGADQVNLQVTDRFRSHPAVVALQAEIDQSASKLKDVERAAPNPGDPSRPTTPTGSTS